MRFYIEYPILLALIIPIIIGIILLMNKTFIKFSSKEKQKDFERYHKRRRIFIIISRCLIALYLLIALSSPYTLKEEVLPGDYSLKVLVDNSTSMQLFDLNVLNKLFDGLRERIPITVMQICSGSDSPIGDSIVNNMFGDDNILLVSDGQNNNGKDLTDVMFFADMLNTTVSAINLKPIHDDNSVVIEGPSEAIMGTPTDIYIKIKKAGNPPGLGLSVKVDNTPVSVQQIEENLYKLSKIFSQGYHKITAQIDSADYFAENNIYYKTLHVLPKPVVLYVTEKNSRLLTMLNPIYTVYEKNDIPDDLSEYSAVIIDDIKDDKLEKKTDIISDYIIEGGGLFVIGGENSFDRGDYSKSIFETILPVFVGEAGYGGELATNVVLVIDISESTGQDFSTRSSNKKVDVEKSLALEILDGISLFDRVGVVAFNHKSYVVSKLVLLGETETNLSERIASLNEIGGTLIFGGLKQAEYLMDGSLGSKNIILISDGVDSIPELSINLAKQFASKGIKLYTVGVGEATNRPFLQTLATTTGASYFEPTETQKLDILFGNREEMPPQETKSLVIFNNQHFITKNLELNGEVTGFNFVVKKSPAQMLISMGDGKPILTVWRYGLGRIAVLSTDSGQKWASELLDIRNSKLFTRTLNWAIGDPQKNLGFYVKSLDTYLGETSKIVVKSDKTPVSDVLKFEKDDEKTYIAYYTPKKVGYDEFFNAIIAVNNPKEYEDIGFNNELRDLVTVTGGKTFEPFDIDKIVEFIKSTSVRKKSTPRYWRWPFALIALIILLIEIFVRKVIESIRRES